MSWLTKKSILFLVSVLAILLVSFCSKEKHQPINNNNETDKKVFKAGVSKIDITGTLHSGYTLHDKLFARTLVLDDGKNRLVFIVADKKAIPKAVCNEAKRLIAQGSNILAQNVMISATHTHSDTPVRQTGKTINGFNKTHTYTDDQPLQPHQALFAKQLAEGVKSAIANLEPAKIGWGVADGSGWIFNRRWIMKEPVMSPHGILEKAQYNPGTRNANRERPAGPVDAGIPFISVQTIDGKPISILANYSTHYAGGVPKNEISADYFGVFSEKIAQLLDANKNDRNFVGIIAYGTGADVNTINYNYGEIQPNYTNYEKMKLVADNAAEEIFKVYQTIKYNDWVSLGVAQSELLLQIRRADPEIVQYVTEVMAGTRANPNSRALIHAKYLLQSEAEWPDTFTAPLQTFKIGDLAVCAVPFEVFAETGLQIKAKSPFKTTFTMSLANGDYGYLPTPAQHELGGYETWIGFPGRVQKDASELVKERLLEMLNKLKIK